MPKNEDKKTANKTDMRARKKNKQANKHKQDDKQGH